MDTPTSKAELEEALDQLVRGAYQNGVTVGNGGSDFIHHGPATPIWDLTITRMEKRFWGRVPACVLMGAPTRQAPPARSEPSGLLSVRPIRYLWFRFGTQLDLASSVTRTSRSGDTWPLRYSQAPRTSSPFSSAARSSDWSAESNSASVVISGSGDDMASQRTMSSEADDVQRSNHTV